MGEPTLESMLSDRARDVAPTQAQQAAAVRSQNHLRDVLDSGQMQGRIVRSFLIGSYARRTAIRPLDDVDIVVVVDPSAWQRPLGRLLDLAPPPERILKSFARAIKYRYPTSGVHVQRRSVGLKMDHLDIDIVPAMEKQERDGAICVPDRSADNWIDSDPSLHSTVVTEINKASKKKFLALVRLLKAWNAGLPSTACLKGFAIETLAARIFREYELVSLADGAASFFDFVAWRGGHKPMRKWESACDVSLRWWEGRKLPDVAGTGSNLLAGADNDRVKGFAHAARVARDAIDAARRARSIDTAWRHVEARFPIHAS